MELFTRVESHAEDLFKLQDVPGGKISKPNRPSLGGESKARPSMPKNSLMMQQQQRASDDSSAMRRQPDMVPPTSMGTMMMPTGRRMPKSKSVIGLAAIPEEEPAMLAVAAESAAASSATSSFSLDENGGGGLRKNKSSASWITTRSLTSEDMARIHYEDLFGCATRNFGKGFTLGFFGRVGINVFFEIVGIMRRRGLPTDGEPLAHAIAGGAKEHGLFLGLLLSVFNSFMYATRNAPMPYARYRGGIAGALSGLASLWALPESMRRSALLFLSVRAFELFCRIGARRGTLPMLPNGDTWLMSLASAMMVYGSLFCVAR